MVERLWLRDDDDDEEEESKGVYAFDTLPEAHRCVYPIPKHKNVVARCGSLR